jgi:hypothetical protein
MYPSISKWIIDGDTRPKWLYQQALKLAAIDVTNSDLLFLHDPDTFMIRRYCYWQHGKCNILAVKDTNESEGYYQVLEQAVGISRQTTHCFVTELHPHLKRDWQALKSRLEQRWNQDFHTALIGKTPFDNHDLKWFSEYELLGNWSLYRGSATVEFQHRFEFRQIEELEQGFGPGFDCVCDNNHDRRAYHDGGEPTPAAGRIMTKIGPYLAS